MVVGEVLLEPQDLADAVDPAVVPDCFLCCSSAEIQSAGVPDGLSRAHGVGGVLQGRCPGLVSQALSEVPAELGLLYGKEENHYHCCCR